MPFHRTTAALALWTTIAALALALTMFVAWPAALSPAAARPAAIPAVRADYRADPRGQPIAPVAPAAIGDTQRDLAAQRHAERAATRP